MSTNLKTAERDPYSVAVRQHFFASGYCGDLSSGDGRVATGEAGEIAHGAAVRLTARIDDGRILEMRYRVFGCPYLVAALNITCARSEGSDITSLKNFRAADTLAMLDAPIGKMGRLLLVEDAIQSLLDTLDE